MTFAHNMIFAHNDVQRLVRTVKRHISRMKTIDTKDGFDLKMQIETDRTWYSPKLDKIKNEKRIGGQWVEVSRV